MSPWVSEDPKFREQIEAAGEKPCTTWGCGQGLYMTDFGSGKATVEVRFPDDFNGGAAGKWLPYCDWCARVNFKDYEQRPLGGTAWRPAREEGDTRAD